MKRMAQTKNDFAAAQNALNNDIRERSFKSIYLLLGEQAYLRNQNRDRLVTAALGLGSVQEAGDCFNYSRFAGENAAADRIIEMAQTLPFFSEKRVIVLEDTGFFDKGANDAAALSEFLPVMPDTTMIIMSEAKTDKRSKLYKVIDKTGFVLDCDSIEPAMIGKWAAGLFKKAGLTISGADLAYFLDRTGTDMLAVNAEIEKLICYKMEDGVQVPAAVTREDILTMGQAQLKDRVFELTDALVRKQADTVFSIYMELCGLQTAPQVILSLLQRQFLNLLRVGELSGKMPDAQIAQELKLPVFVISKRYRLVLSGFKKQKLVSLIDRIAAIDTEYKSGKIDAGAALEMLMAGAAEL